MGTITWLNRYTDERETIPDTDEAIDRFFHDKRAADWIRDDEGSDDDIRDLEGGSL